MRSSTSCATHKRGNDVKIGMVGMRVKEAPSPTTSCTSSCAKLKAPVLGYLRDTQNYVHMAARGLTLWDVTPSRVERDLEQWKPLVELAVTMINIRRWPVLQAARRARARRRRVAHGRPGDDRQVRRRHRRPPVDPRRPRARRRGAVRHHDRARLPHAVAAAELAESALEGRRRAHGRELRAQPRALSGAGAVGQPYRARA